MSLHQSKHKHSIKKRIHTIKYAFPSVYYTTDSSSFDHRHHHLPNDWQVCFLGILKFLPHSSQEINQLYHWGFLWTNRLFDVRSRRSHLLQYTSQSSRKTSQFSCVVPGWRLSSSLWCAVYSYSARTHFNNDADWLFSKWRTKFMHKH